MISNEISRYFPTHSQIFNSLFAVVCSGLHHWQIQSILYLIHAVEIKAFQLTFII
ncbi:DUF2985 domain-containing protein [Salmonella enterica]|nr:DUF2985 domain-containing protein [Salmonella enterica]